MRPRIHAPGAQWQCCTGLEGTMTDWPIAAIPDGTYPYAGHASLAPHRLHPYASPAPAMNHFLAPPPPLCPFLTPLPKGDNPRELRNKAEKHRRDKLNQSITELAAMVPPVLAANKKIDKTGVLRLTAHYLRSHQHVFGNSINNALDMKPAAAQAVLKILKGFLLTTTYKGLIVVVSQNVHQYLGYNEIDLLGHSMFSIVHQDDHKLLRDQLTPRSTLIGVNGELVIPEGPDGEAKVSELLANENRRFFIRIKRVGQRSEPNKYLTCHVEGSFRKSDRASAAYSRRCTVLRRARARYDNPRSSGNDIVFVGVVRLASETFMTEMELESYRMEYRTRHSVDGKIIDCDHRIALTTGFMTNEVQGLNAMNFMHREDVRWVIVALREMYDQQRLYGESCYRLMTKNGQLVYMKTRGHLEVEQDSSRVTSFVCTNTVVDEEEGKLLITKMKKKFMLLVSSAKNMAIDVLNSQPGDNDMFPIEDPRYLEQVILYLVTNLPAMQTDDDVKSGSRKKHLTIIPPCREKIISAIKKIYNVLNAFKKPTSVEETNGIGSNISEPSTSQLNINKTKIKPLDIDAKQMDFIEMNSTDTPTLANNINDVCYADTVVSSTNLNNGDTPSSQTQLMANENAPILQSTPFVANEKWVALPQPQIKNNAIPKIFSPVEFIDDDNLPLLPLSQVVSNENPKILTSTDLNLTNGNPLILSSDEYVASKQSNSPTPTHLFANRNLKTLLANEYDVNENWANLPLPKNEIKSENRRILSKKSSNFTSTHLVGNNNLSLEYEYTESSTLLSAQYDTPKLDTLSDVPDPNVNQENFFQDITGGQEEEFPDDSFFQDVSGGISDPFDIPNIIDIELDHIRQSLDVPSGYLAKKRPTDCLDDVTSKKKVMEPQEFNNELPEFDDLFKDIAEFEEDFTCFEDSDTPSNAEEDQPLPNFLVPSEVQDILNGIDDCVGKKM